ncbi:hypothetical protein TIFTF001_046783 [Ficus carica]|uniref:Uncharacterized protein n=1 Tax=Ficus carica TaxID=3494 RepID=A0AA87ZC22_FICCA|nr:hypothetical protein TIFTF001_046783 [Ficus carica]
MEMADVGGGGDSRGIRRSAKRFSTDGGTKQSNLFVFHLKTMETTHAFEDGGTAAVDERRAKRLSHGGGSKHHTFFLFTLK